MATKGAKQAAFREGYKEPVTTQFGDIRIGDHFVLAGEYLQRGMFDNPKVPIMRVKVSPRMYIKARMLEKGKTPKERLKDVAYKLEVDHLVIVYPRGK
jgi:hypothetical protein